MNLLDLMFKVGVDDSEVDSKLSGIKSRGVGLMKGVGKAVGAGLIAATTAVAGLVTASTKAYAEFEQLQGGVKKLFGAADMGIEQYAQSVGKSVADVKTEYNSLMTAQESVFNNAKQAYMTAGLSANQYMETITGFSASLINSLNGDTVKAAKIGDMAIRDMADNANTFGTSMDYIQQTYQSLAKGQFMMLDNLKLGYGGTKTEMERLLADAEKIQAKNGEIVDYSIDSYADIVEAIHVIQEETKITGTTMKEASKTIEGSLNMTKAAWKNLVAGFADPKANIAELSKQFVTAAGTFMGNLIPAITQALKGISEALPTLLDGLKSGIPNTINSLLPTIISAISTLMQAIVEALPGIVQVIADNLPTIINNLLPPLIEGVVALISALIIALPDIINAIADAMPMIINTLGEALSTSIPQLLPAILKAIIALNNAIIKSLPAILKGIGVAILAILKGLWNSVKSAFNEGESVVTNATIEICQKAEEIWNGLKESLIQKAIEMWNAITTQFSNMSTTISSKIETAKQAVSSKFEEIKTAIRTKMTQAKESAVQIFSSIASGISGKAYSIYTAVVGAFQSGISYIKSLPSKAIQWGKDFVSGLVKGINSKQGVVSSAVSTLAGVIRKYMHFSRPDIGPLHEYEEWMPDFMQGLATGIRNNIGLVEGAIKSVSESMVIGSGFELAGAGGGSTAPNVTINVYGNENQSALDIAEEVVNIIRNEVIRV